MSIKVGINGFGRIGRAVLKNIFRDPECGYIEISAINDLTDPATLAHLFKYDSVQGILPEKISSDSYGISIDGKKIRVFSEREPSKLPWKSLGVDIVIESTGFFTNREAASNHISAGCQKVIISAPAQNPDATIVLGVNQQAYRPAEHNIISNASCTTNCLAPVAYVLNKQFKIEKGFMTTIHSYTSDQRLLDNSHKDLRRARSAGQSIVPTSTGASKSLGKIIPELEGKLEGLAIRVPTPNVSLVDLVFNSKSKLSVNKINNSFKKASKKELKNVLETTNEKLVSMDFNHNPNSAVVDLSLTNVVGNKMGKVSAWYDNEWGFASRMCDLAEYIHKI